MGNIYRTPEKIELRKKLFDIAVEALEREGWKVERVPGIGKSSVRRITKGGQTRLVTIRTTQDTWIAFPRNEDGTWGTLSGVDAVVASSVDDAEAPRFAQVHLIDGDEMRDRFDRNYEARKAAGHSQPAGHGNWVSLYHQEERVPVNRVGAGAGLKHPPIVRVPLAKADGGEATRTSKPSAGRALTIQEAKEAVALGLGVDPSCVKITIEV